MKLKAHPIDFHFKIPLNEIFASQRNKLCCGKIDLLVNTVYTNSNCNSRHRRLPPVDHMHLSQNSMLQILRVTKGRNLEQYENL